MTGNRNEKGQFTKGHTEKSPGRPSAPKELQMAETIKATMTPEKIAKIITKLSDLAARGNVRAAELLLSYCLGRPQQNVNVVQDQEIILNWPNVPLPRIIDVAPLEDSRDE